MIDLERASEFMRTHARLMDRRRFELLVGEGAGEAALAALSGYANPDGGFGYGLEPDLRSTTSQPGGALHAFEVLAEIAPETSPAAARLCDWLDSVAFADGSLPFAFAFEDRTGSAPFWANADPSEPSLHITSAVCGMAHRVADHDPAVASHPWFERATDYCLAEIAKLDERPFSIAFSFMLKFLDAAHDRRTEAAAELTRVGAMLPASGELEVTGGAEGEKLTALDLSPAPDRPLRALLPPDVVAAELDRLEAEQDEAGGWHVDFDSYSAAARLEWSGYRTVWALTILRDHGRVEP
jgi:hypothetical protein